MTDFTMGLLVGLVPLAALALWYMRPEQDRHEHETREDRVHGGPGDAEEERRRSEGVQVATAAFHNEQRKAILAQRRKEDARLVGIAEPKKQPRPAAEDRGDRGYPSDPFMERMQREVDENRHREAKPGVNQAETSQGAALRIAAEPDEQGKPDVALRYARWHDAQKVAGPVGEHGTPARDDIASGAPEKPSRKPARRTDRPKPRNLNS